MFGAAFPLFTEQMYANLGIHWAASVPAFLALACVPFPLVFFKYGPQIRAKCKFAAEAAQLLEEMNKHVVEFEDPEAAEDEAMEVVEQADKIEKLVKSMSRQSRRSNRGPGTVEMSAAGPEAGSPSGQDVEKQDV